MRPSRHGGGRDHGVLVELVDDEPPEAPAATPPEPSPRRGRRLGVAVAVLALGLTTGVVAVQQERAEDARDAAFHAQPGVLPSLAEPPATAWELEADLLEAEADGVLVVSQADGRHVAVDALTREVLWSRPTGPDVGTTFERCRALADDDALAWLRGRGWRSPDRSTGAVLCLGMRQVAEIPSTTAVLVDARTGEELQSFEMTGDPLLSTVHDGAVVLAARVGTDVDAVRWDPRTGREVWRVRHDDVLSTPVALEPRLHADPPALTITSGGGAAISLLTGEELPPVTTPGPDLPASWDDRSAALPDGGVVTWVGDDRRGDGGGPDGEGTVADPDGSVRFDLPGAPLVPDVTDGSAPRVLVAQTDPLRVAGLDTRTGEVRWEAEVAASAQALVRRHGILVVAEPTSAVALDLATGERAWSVDGLVGATAPVLTDGEVVLLAERGGGADLLVARDLRTGRPVWTTTLPAGVESVAALADGALLALGSTGIARLA